jgi:hypothetical protein
MTLPSSGQLNFSDITNEFGTPPNNNLGAFRVSENHGSLSNLPLDNTIPQSGEIKFSDFYGRRLNVVVDCYSGTDPETRVNARTKYNGSQVNVIGGFRSEPSPPIGIKVIINVNKSIQSENNKNQNIVALRTGEYGADCLLRVDVGGSGYIGGAGGNGGNGSEGPGSGSGGQNGNSALGIEYESSDGTTVINNSGTISAGFGGGGGGGGAYDYDKNSSRSASGGGGGGGAGFPAGEGGKGGTGGSDGGNGSDGGQNSAGNGGGGGNNDNEAVGGSGGEGGSDGESANNGGKGSGGEESGGSGGSGGGDGAAIRKESGLTISVVNNGTIRGATDATGVA